MIHREMKLVERDIIEDLTCDVCGESVKKEKDVYEFAELVADWGYWSDGRDGELHRIHFCQECYEKMLKTMGIKVVDIVEEAPYNDISEVKEV